MEQLMYCFGNDDTGGDSSSSETTPSGAKGSSADDRRGFTSRDGVSTDKSRSTNVGGAGGGGDGGGDVFDMSGDYVSQAVESFQSPSVGVMATPMQAATGGAGYSAPSAAAVGGGDNDSDGIPNAIDAMPNTPNVPTVAPAAITPTFAPTLANQPLTVGGQVAVMPYETYQRSPQQMFGYGGLTAAPYSPDAISFQGGAPAAPVDPLSGRSIMQFDVGRAPTPAGTPDDRNFLEKAIAGVGSLFDTQEQRAGVFDPTTGTFQRFDGQTTLQKTSDNMLADLIGNALAGAVGVTPLVGRLDTKTYQPLAGGEPLQYSTSQGGLLSDYIGEQLIPMSEIEARQAEMGGDGDGGQRAPLIIPEQAPEEERAQSAFPAFTPRRYTYQPFTSKFYTIPSRFTRPTSLLG